VIVDLGICVHQWNVQFKHFFSMLYVCIHVPRVGRSCSNSRQWMWIAEIIYAPTILFIKLAILLQYLRLLAPSRTVNPFMFYGAWIIITVNTTFYIITTFISLFLCFPREMIWNKFIKEGHCINQDATIMFTALFNITSDIAILVLPVRSVWKLRIPLRKRIGISLLFATGIV
jgi:hypothetical protein